MPIDRGEFDLLLQERMEPFAALIRQLQGTLSARGVALLTWPAGGATLSNQLTFPHGLSWTPAGVLATVKASGQGQVVAAHANCDATNIYIQGEWVGGFVGTGSLPVAWWAFP